MKQDKIYMVNDEFFYCHDEHEVYWMYYKTHDINIKDREKIPEIRLLTKIMDIEKRFFHGLYYKGEMLGCEIRKNTNDLGIITKRISKIYVIDELMEVELVPISNILSNLFINKGKSNV